MAKQQRSSPLFILAAMLTALAALYFAREILLPIALAILLSFLLTPAANRLERWRIPRVLSVVLVVAMSFSVLGLLGWVVTDQLVELGSQLPANKLKQNLAAKTQWVSDTINKVRNEVTRLGKLREHPQQKTENEEKDTATVGDSKPKKPQTIDKKPSDAPTSPLSAGVAKIDEASEMMESPAEKEAIPVRIVGSSSS